MRRLLLVAVIALPAAALMPARPGTAADAPGVRYMQVVHAYPPSKWPALNFTVSPPGIVLVAVRGGVFLAGWNGWLIEPSEDPVQSVAIADGGRLYTVKARGAARVVTRRPNGAASPEEVLATFPTGIYALSAAATQGVWMWGRQDSGAWEIWYVSDDRSVRNVYSGQKPITALATAGHALLSAMQGGIVVVRPREPPARIIRLDEVIDGLASTPDGSVFVSTPRGIVKVQSDGGLALVAAGLHGPLSCVMGSLFVLQRHSNRVVELRAVATP